MQAVLFDMDGVIVDSEPLHIRHLHQFLITIGVDEPERIETDLKGVSAHDTWRILIEQFDLAYEIDDLIIRSRQSYIDYLESMEKLPSIPGAVQLIHYLHGKGYKLALASSAAPQRIDLFLEKLKLKRYFSVIVSGDDVEHSKLAPDVFLLAADRVGIAYSDCVVVEGANNGVRAAIAAGMKCIAYDGSDHNDDDLSAADIVVKDLVAFTRGLKTGTLPV